MGTTNNPPSILPLSRREMLQLLGLGLLTPGALTGCGSDHHSGRRPADYGATLADARGEIARLLAADGGPAALSIALVDCGRVVWAEAFGYLDKRAGTPVTTDTLFGLASGSKIFAAVAVMILVGRGLVELDAPLAGYVKSFRMADGRYSQITLRMLLNHSSGLPGTDYRNGSTFAPVLGHVDQILKALPGQRLKHAPGEMAVYCNDGFSLTEPLVTAVTGLPYTDFVQREILVPLGMSRSRFGVDTLLPGSYSATLKATGEPNPQEYINVLATGGIYTTPSDLGRLAMMLLNGGHLAGRLLLSPEAVAEMGRDQSATLPLNPLKLNHFGLGWDSVCEGGPAAVGVTAWAKNGGSHYFQSQFNVAPDERLAVVVMGCGGGFDAAELAERFLLHALAEQGSIAEVPAPLSPNPPAPLPVSETALAAMAAHYGGADLFLLGQQDTTLSLSQFFSGHWYETFPDLQQREGGEWISDANPGFAFFPVEADGHRHLAQRSPGGLKHYEMVWIKGQALDPLPPLSEVWKGRVGKNWLVVNDPYSTYLALGTVKPVFNLWQDSGLPGYLVVSGYPIAGKAVDPSTSDERALWCGKVGARDLCDIVVERWEGEERLRVNSTLYRLEDSVAELAPGQASIAVGAEGHGEWRKVGTASSLTVTGADAWYLYDPSFTLLNCVIKGQTLSSGWDGKAPAGAYLLVYGQPQASIEVNTGPAPS